MANLADAESAYLQGRADVETWKVEFEREWYAPLAEMFASMIMEASPESTEKLAGSSKEMNKIVNKIIRNSGGQNANPI